MLIRNYPKFMSVYVDNSFIEMQSKLPLVHTKQKIFYFILFSIDKTLNGFQKSNFSSTN